MLLAPAIASPMLWTYALAGLVLASNLLALWILSGARRVRTGVAINAEDGARHSVPVSDTDPPEVARYLRAHRNAEATIYPFLVLGVIYVLIGGTASVAAPIFVIFVAARLAHSIVYLRALQPWRTATFALSLLAIVALMMAIVVQLIGR